MPPTAAKTRTSEGRSQYQALTNISVPQLLNGKRTDKNDLVPRGAICWLTEDEAAQLMATGHGTGRQHPAVRPVSAQGDPLPQLLPRQLSGGIRQPVTPPPDSDLPRPDPPGSSQVIVNGPPEANEPQPGDETGVPVGAIDIPPRRAATRTAAT